MLERDKQIVAMKRVLWAVVHQEGGEYTIRPDIFDKCHLVNGAWNSVLSEEDGSFTITVDYDNDVIDKNGEFTKADEIIPEEEG
jgi:hypothetical protein